MRDHFGQTWVMDIEAYILIGGRSSRLGRDKAFVEIDGKTLAQRALNTVRESGIATKATFVGGNETQFAIEALTLDAPFIFDMVEGRGPLGGLHAALSYAQTEWIFLLACDYPFISPGLLRFLVGCISDEFGAIVLEQRDGRLQPLCALYKVEAVRHVVEEIIHAPRVPPPMHEIVELLTPRIVKPSEYSHSNGAGHFFSNLNTPEDMNDIETLLRRQISTDS
jgi:molybdopterin-guanine dinucleotide biosynthesis protein A